METPTAAQLFGRIVKQRRKKAALSQEELAAEAACHPTYISLLERGLRNPSLDTVLRLGKGLNCPAWKLVRETETQL